MSAVVGVPEAARRLRLSEMTVYRLVKSGEIPANHPAVEYRVRMSDVEDYAQRNGIEPTPDTWSCLYGDTEGNWITLTGVVGTPSPSRVGAFDRLGDPNTCVRGVIEWMESTVPQTRRARDAQKTAPLQRVVAEGTGVTQTAVSNWVRNTAVLDVSALGPSGSRWLVLNTRRALVWKQRNR